MSAQQIEAAQAARQLVAQAVVAGARSWTYRPLDGWHLMVHPTYTACGIRMHGYTDVVQQDKPASLSICSRCLAAIGEGEC